MLQHRVIFVFAAALLAGACTHKKEPATTQPTAEDFRQPQWTSTPLKIEQKPVAIAEGEPPLAHIFSSTAAIRIVDVTSNAQLAATGVGERTLVSIDRLRGVTIGGQLIVPGPLPAGHHFAIYVDPTTENVQRQGIGLPAPIDQSQSNQSQ